jgi:hypothetical protein
MGFALRRAGGLHSGELAGALAAELRAPPGRPHGGSHTHLQPGVGAPIGRPRPAGAVGGLRGAARPRLPGEAVARRFAACREPGRSQASQGKPRQAKARVTVADPRPDLVYDFESMALPIGSALRSAGRYALRNPVRMARLAQHAVNLRVPIPLDAIRWLVANTPPSTKAPTDVTIAAQPPGISVGATLDLKGTKLRASALISVGEIRVGDQELRVSIRLQNVDLQPLGQSDSPIVALLKSGALDLSKPGNLVNFLPKKPPALVYAHDDEIVLDLMKMPKVASNERLRRALRTVTPVINVAAIGTEGDVLLISMRATPFGFPRALQAARI